MFLGRNMADTEIVTKLDVAARQLSVAITLFFEEQDTVGIHTLTSSAHQILTDLEKRQDIQESVIRNTSAMTDSQAHQYRKIINYPYNFLKHADRDPDGQMDIAPLNRLTQDFIMDAVLMLQRLAREIPLEAKLFWFWFVSKYPKQFDNLPEEGEIARMQELRLADMSFEEISTVLKLKDVLSQIFSS